MLTEATSCLFLNMFPPGVLVLRTLATKSIAPLEHRPPTTGRVTGLGIQGFTVINIIGHRIAIFT